MRLTDAVTAESGRAVGAPSAYSLRAQAAYVRALVDEVGRHHPSDRHLPALQQHLAEELGRLAELFPSETGSLPPPRGEDVTPEPLEVLVVDHDESARIATLAALRQLGFRGRSARSAAEALAQFDEAAAPIVLAEWDLPGTSGLELCAALRRRAPEPYLILATASAENARLLDQERAGADALLHKPLDVGELAERMQAAGELVVAVRSLALLHDRLQSARLLERREP